jgi:hypothetical protein
MLVGSAFISAGEAVAQELEYVFSPEGSDLSDPFPAGLHNGARGLSGPFDLDGDGQIEILVAQHNSAGGRIHVIENQGVDNWELVYSTPVIDSTDNANNARYATGADLDGDGLREIVYVSGSGYNVDENPDYTVGAYVWEYDGNGTDHYGERPSTIGNFYEIDTELGESAAAYAQKLQAVDVDGDGQEELLVPANGPSTHDVFYVLSVSGDFATDEAGTGFAAWNIESRINPRDDNDVFGGGSAADMLAADLDGDGQMEISYHSWNNFNFFNGMVVGDGEVLLPTAATPNSHLAATAPDDNVALFGGTVADIDDDGTDEVFYPDFQSGHIWVMDYSSGDDVLSINPENFTQVIDSGGAGGVAVADIDGDGNPEVITGGSGYSEDAFNDGLPSEFIRITEFNGGDPSDPANYTAVQRIDTSSPIDSVGFHTVYRDSAGVMSQYYETALAKQGTTVSDDDPVFPSGLAYLGDADGDGNVEIALSFQGVDDSLQVIDEVYNAATNIYDRTVRETVAAPVRAFVRIYQFSPDFAVSIEDDERGSLPEGFALHANYPNPFNPSTTFSFTLPREESVTVRVYDVMGRVVKTLVDAQAYAAGTHEITWDATSESSQRVASGTYFYSLETEQHHEVRPMILIK